MVFLGSSEWVKVCFRPWFRSDKGLVQVLFRFCCCSSEWVKVWFRFGSGLMQVWFRSVSGLVQVWFRSGSDLVQVWLKGAT